MGFLSGLKKLFFAGESVVKSASEKAGDIIVDQGSELLNKGKDLSESIGGTVMDKTSGLKDAILDGSDSILESGKQIIDKGVNTVTNNETLNKGLNSMEDIGKTIMDKGSEGLSKLSDVAEDVGGLIKEKGSETLDKFGDLSEKVGSQILDKGGDLSEKIGSKVMDAKELMVDKAQEVGGQMKQKFDETMEKAEALAAEEKLNPKKEFADDTLDASGSLLEGTDDFFSKASKYAEGDYDAMSEGKVIIDEPSKAIPQKDVSPAAGFEDHDGDGNELIDDAIISEEE